MKCSLLSSDESLSSEPFLQVWKQKILSQEVKSDEYAGWGNNS